MNMRVNSNAADDAVRNLLVSQSCAMPRCAAVAANIHGNGGHLDADARKRQIAFNAGGHIAAKFIAKLDCMG